MSSVPEIIEKPLTRDELSAMYQQMCEDPIFANIPGKIELDTWGRKVMSPAAPYHGMLQARLIQRLGSLGGQSIAEAAIVTSAGVLVPDVAWASVEFMSAHRADTPFSKAPELCIEVVSPSNSSKELNEKRAAYLEAGAVEVWIVYPRSRRIERFGPDGPLEQSVFSVDLARLFD